MITKEMKYETLKKYLAAHAAHAEAEAEAQKEPTAETAAALYEACIESMQSKVELL